MTNRSDDFDTYVTGRILRASGIVITREIRAKRATRRATRFTDNEWTQVERAACFRAEGLPEHHWKRPQDPTGYYVKARAILARPLNLP